MGQSENFSLTGMAFRSTLPLEKGDEVTVSFNVPGVKKRIQIGCAIARVVAGDSGDGKLFGASYLGLESGTQRLLTEFILNG